MSARGFGVERASPATSTDPALAASVILLAGVGLVTLASASAGFAERIFDDRLYFLRKQAVVGAGGAVVALVASRIDLDLLRKLVMPLVIGTWLFCLLPFVPGVGETKNGATLWVKILGWSYQPSELAKLVLPVYLAHILAKKEERLDDASSGVLPPAIVTLLFFLVIYLQNDFSTAALLAVNALAVFFLAGVRLRHFAAVALVSVPAAALMVLSREHRLERILTFIRPEADPLGAGYQVRASLATVASGGFWGKGLGLGTRKLASVPEIQSDFVFAAFAEEAGFVGVLLAASLFAFFVARAFRAAVRSEDSYRRLLGLGLATSVATQILLNLAVVSGFVPATGIPLPFFSAGGSSFATTLVAAGVLVNISRSERNTEGSDV